jgi:dTMP kinase
MSAKMTIAVDQRPWIGVVTDGPARMSFDNELLALDFYEHEYAGHFLTLSGMDGAGKSTLTRLLGQRLAEQGHDVVVTKSPPKSTDPVLYKRYMTEPSSRGSIDFRALHCSIMGNRLQHIHEVVRPALSSGKIVVCDRYIYDAVANLLARGYRNEPWLVELCHHFPRPDTAIVLEVPVQLATTRLRTRGSPADAFVEHDFFPVLHAAYQHIAAKHRLHLIKTTSDNPDPAIKGALEIVGRPARLT